MPLTQRACMSEEDAGMPDYLYRAGAGHLSCQAYIT